MKTIKAKTRIGCNNCSHLEICNEKGALTNRSKPWILICPYSKLLIKTIPTSQGMEEQEIGKIKAPWNCKIRQSLRKVNREEKIELYIIG